MFKNLITIFTNFKIIFYSKFRFLNEQLEDAVKHREDANLNASTIDEIMQLKKDLESLSHALQKEQSAKEIANSRILELESELEKPKAAGDRTMAFNAADEAMAHAEHKSQELKTVKNTNSELQDKIVELKDELEFLKNENLIFEGVNEEIDSLKKINSDLSNSQNEKLTEVSSINESLLRQTEKVNHFFIIKKS